MINAGLIPGPGLLTLRKPNIQCLDSFTSSLQSGFLSPGDPSWSSKSNGHFIFSQVNLTIFYLTASSVSGDTREGLG